MNAMMNKLQVCGATAGSCSAAAVTPRAAAARPTLPRFDTRRLGLGVAGVVAGTALAGLAAVVLVVARAGLAEPLPIVELPRVVIEAKRLPAGACPVPVAAGAACTVPTEATPTATTRTTDTDTSPRTPL